MSESDRVKQGVGWKLPTVLLFGFLLLYVLSSGPMFVVFAQKIYIDPAGLPGPATSASPQFAYYTGAYDTIYAPVLMLAQRWEPMSRYLKMFAESIPDEVGPAPVSHAAHPAPAGAGPL